MRERDIRGVSRREHRSLTRADRKATPLPGLGLVGRDFTARVRAGRLSDADGA